MVRVEYFYKLPDGTYVDTTGDPGALGYIKVGERLGKPIYTKPELVPEPMPPPPEPAPVVIPPPPEPIPEPAPPPPTPIIYRIRTPEGRIITVEQKPPELTRQALIGGEKTWITEEFYQERLAFERERLAKEIEIEPPPEHEDPEAYREEVKKEIELRVVGEPPPPAVMTEIIEEIVPSGGIGEARIITTRITTPTGVEEKVRTVTYVPTYYDQTTDKEVAAPKPGITYAVGTIKVTESEWEATPEVTKSELRSEYDVEIRPDVPKVKEAIVVHIKPKQFLETEESYQRRLSAKEGYIIAKKAGDVKAAELFGKEMRTARQTLYGVTAEKYEEAAKVAKDELTKRFLLGMAGAAKAIEIQLEHPLAGLIKLPFVIAEDPLKFITEIPKAPRRFISAIGVAFGAPPIPEPVPPPFLARPFKPSIPFIDAKFAPLRTISMPSGLVTEAMERKIEEWAPATAFDPELKMDPVLRGLAIAGEVAGAILISTASIKIMKKGVEVAEKAFKTLKIDVKTGIGRIAKKAVTKTKTAVKAVEKAEKKKTKTIKITKKMIEEGLPLEETGISERVPYTIDEIKTLMKYQPLEAKKLLADIEKTTRAGYKEMLKLGEFDKAASYLRGLRALKELIAAQKVGVFVEPALLVSVKPTVITKVSALVAGATVSRVSVLAKSTVSTKTSPAVSTMVKTTLLPRVKVKARVKVLTLQEQKQAEKQRQLLLLAQIQLQKKAQIQLLGQSEAVTTILKKKEDEVVIPPYEPPVTPPYEPTPEPPYEPPVTPPYEPLKEIPPRKPPKRPPRIPPFPWWQLPTPIVMRRRVPIREVLKPKGEYAPSITAVYERIIVRKPLKQTIFSPFDIRPIVSKKEKEEEKKRRKRLLARVKVRDILKPSITGKPSKVVARISLKPSIKLGGKAPKKGGIREALKQSIKF